MIELFNAEGVVAELVMALAIALASGTGLTVSKLMVEGVVGRVAHRRRRNRVQRR